ncbi:PIG-L deacetylase family protein [Deinococcus aquatilis]|uniref:PIG-L deacetylase family protein n=1 Tax=Deinococcus aquatilis TaxID=519440 RepID=UPI00036A2439|nr:PIG-L deacetylase family protein [Deinococcus aquatilis]
MQPSLLALFAHPDDEVLRCGGTLARYAQLGVRVTLVCLTRGEAGRNTDPALGELNLEQRDLAQLREAELRESCLRLGIDPPIFLGYHDSGRNERLRRDDPLATINADPLEMEAKVLTVVAQVQPQVMLGFDPHGIYGHPDHLVAHRLVAAVFARSGSVGIPVARLYYTVQTHTEMRLLQNGRGLGVLSGLDPETYAVCEATIAARIDISLQAERKRRALSAHRTQTGPLSTLGNLTEMQWQALSSSETFSLGGSRTPIAHYPHSDLFEGLPLTQVQDVRA